LLNDNLSDGTLGTPKRIPSLLGQSETAPYGWTGRFGSLQQQSLHSLQSTMATDYSVSRQILDALAAYLGSLPPPPSVLTARGEDVRDANWHSGQAIFQELSCAQCHAGHLYTSPDVYDVGLVDEREHRLFNPPSLLGVSQRQGALFHDGRANSLHDVFTRIGHQVPERFTQAQVDALVAFLESL
jgi:cytochrome c peroxidase